MKQSKDPFEAAFEEQEESPPQSPVVAIDGTETLTQDQDQTLNHHQNKDHYETTSAKHGVSVNAQDDDDDMAENVNARPANKKPLKSKSAVGSMTGKGKEEDDDEEEENMEVELGKLPSSSDPDKMAKMQAILSKFTEEQMSRYESFRRSGFQKANMKRLLGTITGSAKVSIPMTIVVSGIAKMFVGELVEAARIVMAEREESGPIRPCHLREAYRRLKLEGKVPKRSVPRLFR